MSIIFILGAIIAAFLVVRFVTGMIKVAVLGLIVLAAIFFIGQG